MGRREELLYKEKEAVLTEVENIYEIDTHFRKRKFLAKQENEGTMKRLLRYVQYLHKNAV